LKYHVEPFARPDPADPDREKDEEGPTDEDVMVPSVELQRPALGLSFAPFSKGPTLTETKDYQNSLASPTAAA
jgi:hypothetical protein